MAETDYTKDQPVLQLSLPLLANQIDPPLRDNRDTMAYPFFSLEKHKRTSIEYHDDKVSIFIDAPERFGVATIWDWDLIIVLCAQLNDAQNLGKTPSPRLSFSPHQILKQMGRGTGGKDYQELAQSIRRLKATTIVTNIRPGDQPGEQEIKIGAEIGFSWLNNYLIPKKYQTGYLTPKEEDGEADPTRPWEVTLHPWLYNAVVRQNDILAVHQDYFELTGGLERFLYRIGRKSLGNKDLWNFRMSTLHKLSGTKSPLKTFAYLVRKIAHKDNLPELHLEVIHSKDGESVTFFPDRAKLPRSRRGITPETT